ncbi:hypothetical protein CR513_57290, partial [Mucuna pruriens]
MDLALQVKKSIPTLDNLQENKKGKSIKGPEKSLLNEGNQRRIRNLHTTFVRINLTFVPKDTWWVDSGATTHISVTIRGCLWSRPLSDDERFIFVGDDNKAAVKAIGTFRLYCYLYLIHEKSQSLDIFKSFKTEVELQLGKKIKAVKSDRCAEYYGRYDGLGEQRLGPFVLFLKKCEIFLQYTMPGKPSMNESLCGEVLKIVVYILNRGYKFYDLTSRSFFEMRNAIFLKEVKFEKEENIRNVVFEE